MLISSLNPLMILIRTIDYQQTYPLRHAILRPEFPLKSCHFKGDSHPNSIHLGGFEENRMVGILSAIPNPYPENGRRAFQIRGMAVAPSSRKKGIATLLLQHFEELCLQEGKIQLLWLNARIDVQKLYLRNQFTPVGTPFMIEPIGMHQQFFKSLPHEPV